MAFSSLHKAYGGTSCSEKMTNRCKSGENSIFSPFFGLFFLVDSRLSHLVIRHLCSCALIDSLKREMPRHLPFGFMDLIRLNHAVVAVFAAINQIDFVGFIVT